MRDLVREYFDGGLSRRGFFSRLVAAGFTAAAARSVVRAADVGAGEEPAAASGAYPLTGTGGELLVEQVKAAGSRYVFTNPGSLEVGFFDALTDRPELQVIVGLHEGIVISMADGYHKMTGEPAFVNVHAAVGTAQMAGQLYNAHRDGSALVVTAGMQDPTIYSDDLALGPAQGFTQADVNRQFTKISWEVRNGASTAVAVRRAYKVAATAPGGPVYVGVSQAAFQQPAQGEVWPREAFLVKARPRAAADQVQALATMLLEAKRPVVMVGDEAWKAGAPAEALAFCEMLGLAVVVPGFSVYQHFPTSHAQFVGGRYASERPYPFGSADLVVQLGARDPGGNTVPERPFVDSATRFAAVGIDTSMLGRTQPLALAVVGDVKETLSDLIDALKAMATRDRLTKIRAERLALITPAVEAARAERLAQARGRFDQSPMHPDRLGYELEQSLDKNAIVVTENLPGLMGKNDFFRFGHRPDEKLGISTVGSSLGWGTGAAIGVKLAAPDRLVVLSIGDGSVMYSAAGFWSMARYHVPVLTVVWNNRNYQTVRGAYHRYNRRMAATGRYHGVFLGDPEIDFVKLAESQGVLGQRVTSGADLAAAIKKGVEETRSGNPYVLDVAVACIGGGAESTWHQKFSAAAPPTSNG